MDIRAKICSGKTPTTESVPTYAKAGNSSCSKSKFSGNNKQSDVKPQSEGKKFADATTHPEYFEMGGIAYYGHCVEEGEEPGDDDSTQSGLKRSELIGSYDMIHYKGIRDCCDDKLQEEYIGRAIDGTLEIELVKWKGKAALCGRYRMSKSIGEGWSEDGGKPSSTEGSIIELVHGNVDPEIDSSDAEGSEDAEEDEEKSDEAVDELEADEGTPERFAGVGYFTRSEWWHDDLQYSDYGDLVDNFQARLSVLSQDSAIGLESDWPVKESVPSHPKTCGVVPRDFTHAQEMLANYEDGSNSWLLNHFPSLSSETALRIRQFVLPPPVLMLKKGDLVLDIEEPCEAECWRKIVFRKKPATKSG
ncbi:MAG: hypothetical protein SGILL_008270 [Bacillariaceae sp.]